MSTGTLEQPPQPNPFFATLKARKTLVGLHLDVALQRCRGYSVDVLKPGDKVPRFAAKRVVLVVGKADVVEAAL